MFVDICNSTVSGEIYFLTNIGISVCVHGVHKFIKKIKNVLFCDHCIYNTIPIFLESVCVRLIIKLCPRGTQ